MSEANALHSLYGGTTKRRRALAGNVGVKQEDREQTVFTPMWFVSQLVEEMEYSGLEYALDPCTTQDNPTGAADFYTEETDGLSKCWKYTDGAFFFNPPFKDLEEWLCKARNEWWLEGARGYGLVPTRPQREWFGELVAGLPVCNLRPLKFVGHKQAFPAPLSLICYGLPVPKLIEPGKKQRSMIVSVSTYSV